MQKQTNEILSEIIGRDLLLLSEILINEGLCTDTSSLNTAGNLCLKSQDSEFWSYKVGNLDFALDSMGKIIPSGATDMFLRFSIIIKSDVFDEKVTNNPLQSLFFDIEITGNYIDGDYNLADLHCAWHLDKHISKPEDGQAHYSHPEYHFTFGGNKMANRDYGATLIFPTPRFAYPPMDAILGVDFILQNYFHKDRIKGVVQDPIYRNILKKSQERLWKPYFKSLASKWIADGEFNDNFTYEKLFPLLNKD